MTNIHSASRTILATPRAIFRALIDAEAMPRWRAPKGMHMRVERLEPRPGGRFRLVLSYDDPAAGAGKSGANSDIVEGRFAELIAEERVVEEVRFQSDDPAYAGTMRVTTTLAPVSDGTKVTITAENVPSGISEGDHRQGMESTLKNLADFLE
ncbi:SRPBCC domain-containing protein [Sphingomonas lycopersici]|uniref:SRPBCC domain-containing protein n=1 Tax=Sphingomonas lycopersici TaxID=2951807 RepID=UPI0022389FF4|nr:SRPBCC domain-containing protein [Sphingomonas lycopersici]